MKLSNKSKEWLKIVEVKAIKAMAQTFIATVGSAVVLSAVDWKLVLSTTVLAGILSLATSLAELSEFKEGGV